MRMRKQRKRGLTHAHVRAKRTLYLLQSKRFEVLRIDEPWQNDQDAGQADDNQTAPPEYFFQRNSHNTQSSMEQGDTFIGMNQ